MDPIETARQLRREAGRLKFGPPASFVYNPLDYAWKPHKLYLERYGSSPREVLLLGMNPGPFGMAQTGIPFGEVSLVRDWLGLKAPVGKPAREHPKRPILGFSSKRSEVSGARLWGWARDAYKTPEDFFRRFFILNYCPLVFMEEGGRNLTPDKLPARESEPLSRACDKALRRLVDYYKPKWVIGVGAFAEKKAREALEGKNVRIASLLHPSPANPAANRGWREAAEAALGKLGIL